MTHLTSFFTYYVSVLSRTIALTSGIRFMITTSRFPLYSGATNKHLTAYSSTITSGQNIVRTQCKSTSYRFRKIDYKRRLNFGTCGTIRRIEYCPGHSCFISLVLFKNNVIMYHLAYNGATVFDEVYNLYNIAIRSTPRVGDSCIIRYLSIGAIINNIEVRISSGSQYLRAAGMYGILLRKLPLANLTLVRFRLRVRHLVSLDSVATLGMCSNHLWRMRVDRTAGRSVRLGYKPIVRGVAKNPVDHPHGGGNGHKSKKAVPRTLWGKLLKWKKTRTHFITKKTAALLKY